MKLLCVSREGRVIALDVEDNLPLGQRIMLGMTPTKVPEYLSSRFQYLEARTFEFVPTPGDGYEEDLMLYEEVV